MTDNPPNGAKVVRYDIVQTGDDRDETCPSETGDWVKWEDYDQLAKERDHWKANHDNAIAIKRAVLDRPDLSDRSARVSQLIAERDDARQSIAAQIQTTLDVKGERDVAIALLRQALPFVALSDHEGPSDDELRERYPLTAVAIDKLRKRIAGVVG